MKKCNFGNPVVVGLDQLDRFAKELAQALEVGDVLALSGPVGAGKTTFVKALLAYLKPNEWVSSPTFSLVNTYGEAPKVFHMDWYRIENETALQFLDLPMYFDQKEAISIIEWADLYPKALPQDAIKLNIAFTDADSQREFCFNALG